MTQPEHSLVKLHHALEFSPKNELPRLTRGLLGGGLEGFTRLYQGTSQFSNAIANLMIPTGVKGPRKKKKSRGKRTEGAN